MLSSAAAFVGLGLVLAPLAAAASKPAQTPPPGNCGSTVQVVNTSYSAGVFKFTIVGTDLYAR